MFADVFRVVSLLQALQPEFYTNFLFPYACYLSDQHIHCHLTTPLILPNINRRFRSWYIKVTNRRVLNVLIKC
jgi:hypothetical protein